jgi:excisionase family DNA binding protein
MCCGTSLPRSRRVWPSPWHRIGPYCPPARPPRPTLVRLLESGEIPFDKPGRHRRVRLADLLAHQQRASRGRAVLLDQMVADSEDAGLYDLPGEAPFERLPVSDDQRPE